MFPELTVYNKDGQPESVAYHLLPGLLLNELQKEHEKTQAATAELRAAKQELASQRSELDAMKVQVAEVRQLKETLARLEETTKQLRAQQAALQTVLKAAPIEAIRRVSQSNQQ